MKELSRKPCKELSSQPRKQLSRQSLRYRYINPSFKKNEISPDTSCELYFLLVAFTIVYYLLLITIFMAPIVFASVFLYSGESFSLIIFPEYVQMILLPGMIIATGTLVCGTIAGCMLGIVFGAIFILDGISKGVTFVQDNYDFPSISLQPITKFFNNLCTPLEIVD